MAHTKGNWSSKGLSGCVITDKIPDDYTTGSGHDDVDYYGGFLIGESIHQRDVDLIAAAPDLLEALQMVNDADNDNKADGSSGIPPLAKAKIEAAINKALGK